MSPVDSTQAGKAFVDALTKSTPLRAQAMQNLDDAHQAQESALAIEGSRVAARYGADSAQSKAIQARITAHAARGRIISAERQRTRIPAPMPLDDAFIVYGLVLDAKGNPLRAIDVSAIGSSGASVASTKSMADGSFVLPVPAGARLSIQEPAVPVAKGDIPIKSKGDAAPKAADGVKTDNIANAANAAKAEGVQSEQVARGTAAPVTSFQLVLTDAANSVNYRYPETFQVTVGTLAYREITMPASR